MGRSGFLIALSVSSACLAWTGTADSQELPASAQVPQDVWLVASGGLWEQEESVGRYRVVVLRHGSEPAEDTVDVEILKIVGDLGSERHVTLRTIRLPSPSYKGNVISAHIHSVSKIAAVVDLRIEMRAMNGVVLSDVFLVSPAGEVRPIVVARGVELLPD